MKTEKSRKNKSKVLKAIAFSEMFVMVLASFAFAFILSAGSVSAVELSELNGKSWTSANGANVKIINGKMWVEGNWLQKNIFRKQWMPVDTTSKTYSTYLSEATTLKFDTPPVSPVAPSASKPTYSDIDTTPINSNAPQIGVAPIQNKPINSNTGSGLITKLADNVKTTQEYVNTINTKITTLQTNNQVLNSIEADMIKQGDKWSISQLTTPQKDALTASGIKNVDTISNSDLRNQLSTNIRSTTSDIKTQEATLKSAQERVTEAQNLATLAKDSGGKLTQEQLLSYQAAKAAKDTGQTLNAEQESIIKTFDDAKTATAAASATGEGYKFFGLEFGKTWTGGWGTFGGNLLEGIGWAAIVIGGIKIFESIGLIPEEYAEPLYQSLSAGIIAGKATYGLLAKGGALSEYSWLGGGANAGMVSFGVGALVTYLIFSYQYTKEETQTKTLTFKCMSWQAPRGGEKCGECNKDPMKPCSEYRCKALGQACELLNKGTGQEKCEWVNRNDAISPGIKPWNQVLTNGYTYAQVKSRPAGGGSATSGMWIERATENANGNKCIDPYTPIEFGILTYNEKNQAEPAQCKIDYTRTKSFSEMGYYFGDSNLYLTNHSQKLSMPSISSLKTIGENESEGLEMEQTPGEYTFYVRCADANGNENEDEFAIRFCIDEGPDMTAPIIKGTSFGNQTTPVQFGQDNLSIEVYTNEPAKCFWEREDRDYQFMANEMICSNNVFEMNAELLYTCKTTLTSIEDRKNNEFFFRCVDLSENQNAMQEGYQFTVIGTQPLDIIATGPNGTIAGSTSVIKTTLHIETANGYNNGESRCFYSATGENSSYIEFFYNTSEFSNIHDQVLDLGSGTYNYYFRCIDLGGNSDENSTTFTLDMDRESPLVVRAYNENNQLLVITDESSDCRYNTQSCSFDFITGLPMSNANSTTHEAEWKEQNYYIKCADSYNNQPDTTECSIVVRPYLG